MLVETIFWFHPFVWWIQTRLVAERERVSCRMRQLVTCMTANDPQIYAEAILKVCKLLHRIAASLRLRRNRARSEEGASERSVSQHCRPETSGSARKIMLAVAVAVACMMPLFVGMVLSLVDSGPSRKSKIGQRSHRFISSRSLRSSRIKLAALVCRGGRAGRRIDDDKFFARHANQNGIRSPG